MPGFGDQVAVLAAKYQARMRAVMRESVQETVEIAQRISQEGGRMRVKTGFLRAKDRHHSCGGRPGDICPPLGRTRGFPGSDRGGRFLMLILCR